MLNDAKLRAAMPRDKAYKLTDGQRLYLLVTPQGSKLWRFNYAYDSKQKTLAIGRYPVVSLLMAREKRDEAKRLLAEGHDPSIAKKLKIEANIEASRMTFERVAREWHEANKPQWAKVHAAEVIRTLERDVFPRIGSIPIRDLTPPKILEMLRAIESRSAIETAKRVRQLSPQALRTRGSCAVQTLMNEPGYAMAEFRTTRAIHVLDLTTTPFVSIFDSKLGRLNDWCQFMRSFIADFQRPVAHDGAQHIEYVPTQIVTEYIHSARGKKKRPIDGILYSSVKIAGSECFVLFADKSDVAPLPDTSKNPSGTHLLKLRHVVSHLEEKENA